MYEPLRNETGPSPQLSAWERMISIDPARLNSKPVRRTKQP